jgi:hypothetical protein
MSDSIARYNQMKDSCLISIPMCDKLFNALCLLILLQLLLVTTRRKDHAWTQSYVWDIPQDCCLRLCQVKSPEISDIEIIAVQIIVFGQSIYTFFSIPKLYFLPDLDLVEDRRLRMQSVSSASTWSMIRLIFNIQYLSTVRMSKDDILNLLYCTVYTVGYRGETYLRLQQKKLHW